MLFAPQVHEEHETAEGRSSDEEREVEEGPAHRAIQAHLFGVDHSIGEVDGGVYPHLGDHCDVVLVLERPHQRQTVRSHCRSDFLVDYIISPSVEVEESLRAVSFGGEKVSV